MRNWNPKFHSLPPLVAPFPLYLWGIEINYGKIQHFFCVLFPLYLWGIEIGFSAVLPHKQGNFHFTYEELKFYKTIKVYVFIDVSTLPMRNWNVAYLLLLFRFSLRFHFTYEELKRFFKFQNTPPYFLFPLYLWGIETDDKVWSRFKKRFVSTLPMRN